MHKVLEEMITQTVAASQLPATEQKELRQELVAHITAQVLDLQLQGKKETEIIEQIRAQFGDTTIIGQQLFAVHHRFEWIPWIGPLLYYLPLRLGVQLLLMHVAVVIIAFFGGWSLIADYLQQYISLPNTLSHILLEIPKLRRLLTYSFMAFIPLLEGMWLWYKCRSLPIYLEATLLSLMPSAIMIFAYLLQYSISGIALLEGDTNLLHISLTLVLYSVAMTLIASSYAVRQYLKNQAQL